MGKNPKKKYMLPFIQGHPFPQIQVSQLRLLSGNRAVCGGLLAPSLPPSTLPSWLPPCPPPQLAPGLLRSRPGWDCCQRFPTPVWGEGPGPAKGGQQSCGRGGSFCPPLMFAKPCVPLLGFKAERGVPFVCSGILHSLLLKGCWGSSRGGIATP